MRSGLALALAVLLVIPAAAAAHAVITIGGGELSYSSEDTGSRSRLEIQVTFGGVNVYDPGAIGGMQAPFTCQPGRTDANDQVVEYRCPAGGIDRLRADVGGDEDTVTISGPLRRTVDGGYGADTIRTGDAPSEVIAGPGNDNVLTGAGDDLLQAGAGSDVIETGGGADRIESDDGERDQVRCGDGADTVVADTVDEAAPDCEAVERRFVAPPATSSEGDLEAPRLSLDARRSQRVSGRSAELTAVSTEAGSIAATAYLSVAGINERVKPVTRDVTARRRVRLRLRLSASQIRRVRRDVRRGRRPYLSVRVAATDRAGNSSRVRRLRIRVRA